MRSAVAGFVITVLLAGGADSKTQETGADRDGNWWADKTGLSKLSFVEGYVDGLAHADVVVTLIANENPKAIEPTVKDAIRENLDFYRITYGQFVEGLDKFYSDYRNKRIRFDAAIGHVRDEIRGVPHEQLERDLEILRRGAVREKP